VEYVQCGTIKAQFPLDKGCELFAHPAYVWASYITRPRVTDHFIYIMLGHTAIRDNEHARWLIEQIEARRGYITRLDFAVDYLAPFAFDDYYELQDDDKRPFPSIIKTPQGTTVYVGKRSSSLMLRVYDKRAEILHRTNADIGFALTRIELEVKHKMVKRYRNLFMSGQTDIILSTIQHKYKLRLFTLNAQVARPTDIQEKVGDVFAFVQRYRRIIGEAYHTNKQQFLEIIGE